MVTKEDLVLTFLAIVYCCIHVFVAVWLSPTLSVFLGLHEMLVMGVISLALAIGMLVIIQRIPGSWYFIVVYEFEEHKSASSEDLEDPELQSHLS